MTMGPRQYARYKAGERVWDTRHYEGEPDEFTAADGTVWKRVATTVGMFAERSHAIQELDRLEARAPQGEEAPKG
jgi:hypothetical protein